MDLGPSIGGQLTRHSQQNSDSDDDKDIISIIHGIDIAVQEGAKGRLQLEMQEITAPVIEIPSHCREEQIRQTRKSQGED